MINENNKDTWCVNPYLNLSIHSSGKLKPCCMSRQFYRTEEGDTVSEVSVIELWNSIDRKKVIEDLSNGVKLQGCDFCWKEEESGKESKRIRDNKMYAHAVVSDNMKPIVVDISLGNLCNLKCRICSPSQSSQWIVEEAALKFSDNKAKYYANDYFKKMKNSFSDDNDLFWKDIISLLSDAEKIDIAGGEPFYIKKQWELVQKLTELGISKNQHIHYNTNGTIFPDEHIEHLNKFKIVDIQISSDGIDKKFEYMRHPASWEEVEKNIDKFLAIKNSNPNWMIGICISVSAFNVYNFFETYEHYAQKGLLIYVNVVHDHRSVKIIPKALKDKIIDKLKSEESKFLPRQWEKDRNMVCNYLENSVSFDNDWINFLKEISMRDSYRKEKFEEIFHDYSNLIKELNLDYVAR